MVNYQSNGEPISQRTLLLNLTMMPSLAGAPYVDGMYRTLFVELRFYLLVLIVLLTGTVRHVKSWLGLWMAASIASALGSPPGGSHPQRCSAFHRWLRQRFISLETDLETDLETRGYYRRIEARKAARRLRAERITTGSSTSNFFTNTP